MVPLVLAVILILISIAVGVWTRRWVRSASDFLVAGREVGTFVQFCSFASGPFAAGHIVAVPAMAAAVGFWPAFWNLTGMGLVFIFCGLTSYRLLRRSGVYTFAEWVELRYGRNARTVVAVAQFIGLTFGLGANVFGMAAVLAAALKWPFLATLIGVTLTCLVYLYASGAWGGTVNDSIQFLLGGTAYLLLPLVLFSRYGGLDFLAQRVDAVHFLGSFKAPIFTLGGPPVALFAIFGWLFFNLTAQHYYIKVAACRNEKAAVRGVVAGGFFIIAFAAVLALVGVYARAVAPGNWPPVEAYGRLIATLPLPLQALMLLALLSAGLSTAASGLIGSASLGARDLYQGLLHPEATPRQMLWPSRIAVLVASILSFIAAFLPGGPAPMLALMGTFLGVTAVPFVAGIFWPRATSAGATWGTLAGVIAGFAWRFLLPATYWQSIDSSYVSVGVTLVVFWAVSLATEPAYFGRKDWPFANALGRAPSGS